MHIVMAIGILCRKMYGTHNLLNRGRELINNGYALNLKKCILTSKNK
jgi:hypothetical protein